MQHPTALQFPAFRLIIPTNNCTGKRLQIIMLQFKYHFQQQLYTTRQSYSIDMRQYLHPC